MWTGQAQDHPHVLLRHISAGMPRASSASILVSNFTLEGRCCVAEAVLSQFLRWSPSILILKNNIVSDMLQALLNLCVHDLIENDSCLYTTCLRTLDFPERISKKWMTVTLPLHALEN